MPAKSLFRTPRAILRGTLAAVSGVPQVFAFLPAATLAAYWLGGEALLLVTAFVLPAMFAAFGAFTRPGLEPGAAPDPWETVPGRETAIARLESQLEKSDAILGNLAIIAIGLDDYRDVEKRLGPAGFGDIVSRTGDRIAATVRISDLVVQLDPATFAIILTTPRRDSLETLLQLCSRLQAGVAAPISLGATRVYVTASIGVARPRTPGPTSAEALIAAAEMAQREASAHGPGSVRAYTAGSSAPARPVQPLAGEVAEALAAGHILPWFQPQLHTDTGALSGVEALARWAHPEHGLVPPSEFLAIVEGAGLSERLGATILHRALGALRRFEDAGIGVPRVAVNFSAAELRNPGLVERVRWELDRFALSPDRLTIEVLETVIEETGDDIVTRNLAGLAALGSGIDLDDFGTGHAAIGNIRRFSIQRVKIDRSFVTKLDTDTEQQAVVSAMILMSGRLGLDTIAEGVETAAEHAALARLGCRHVQGFAIARPMPETAFRNWAAARAADPAPASGGSKLTEGGAATVQSGKTA